MEENRKQLIKSYVAISIFLFIALVILIIKGVLEPKEVETIINLI